MFTFRNDEKMLEIQHVSFSKKKTNGKIFCDGEGYVCKGENEEDYKTIKSKGSGFSITEALGHMLEKSMKLLEKEE